MASDTTARPAAWQPAISRNEADKQGVEYDLRHMLDWSFIIDLKILIATIFSAAAYRTAY